MDVPFSAAPEVSVLLCCCVAVLLFVVLLRIIPELRAIKDNIVGTSNW